MAASAISSLDRIRDLLLGGSNPPPCATPPERTAFRQASGTDAEEWSRHRATVADSLARLDSLLRINGGVRAGVPPVRSTGASSAALGIRGHQFGAASTSASLSSLPVPFAAVPSLAALPIPAPLGGFSSPQAPTAVRPALSRPRNAPFAAGLQPRSVSLPPPTERRMAPTLVGVPMGVGASPVQQRVVHYTVSLPGSGLMELSSPLQHIVLPTRVPTVPPLAPYPGSHAASSTQPTQPTSRPPPIVAPPSSPRAAAAFHVAAPLPPPPPPPPPPPADSPRAALAPRFRSRTPARSTTSLSLTQPLTGALSPPAGAAAVPPRAASTTPPPPPTPRRSSSTGPAAARARTLTSPRPDSPRAPAAAAAGSGCGAGGAAHAGAAAPVAPAPSAPATTAATAVVRVPMGAPDDWLAALQRFTDLRGAPGGAAAEIAVRLDDGSDSDSDASGDDDGGGACSSSDSGSEDDTDDGGRAERAGPAAQLKVSVSGGTTRVSAARPAARRHAKESPAREKEAEPVGRVCVREEDYALYKKRRGIEPEQKLFCVVGTYYDPLRQALLARGWQENSVPALMQWDLAIVANFRTLPSNLRPEQIVNHFRRCHAVTTKLGLCRNLQAARWHQRVCTETFYPVCHVLSERSGELREWMESYLFVAAQSVLKRHVAAIRRREPFAYNVRRLELALRLCSQHADRLRETYADQRPADFLTFDAPVLGPEDVAEFLALEKAAPDASFDPAPALTALHEKAVAAVNELLALDPQFHMNGVRNIWIVKPGALSRGRGIRLFNSLPAILDFVSSTRTEYVAQKYIENPLIIKGRKFDIRQWVLVTDWNPLTVWMYGDCYLRFTTVPFSMDNLSDRYIHLSNRCVQVSAPGYDQTDIPGNMWNTAQFRAYLVERYGSDLWESTVLPRIKQIIPLMLSCGQDEVVARKNSFEIYGFDFMIDDNFSVYGIEVNCYPDLSVVTPTMAIMVPAMMEDLIKVVVDSRGVPRPRVSTGLWQCIYRMKVDEKELRARQWSKQGKLMQKKSARLMRGTAAGARRGVSDGDGRPRWRF